MKNSQNDPKLSLIINLFIQYFHQVSKYSEEFYRRRRKHLGKRWCMPNECLAAGMIANSGKYFLLTVNVARSPLIILANNSLSLRSLILTMVVGGRGRGIFDACCRHAA
jgi:hypothetical protein